VRESGTQSGGVAGIVVTDPPYLSLSARGIKFARRQRRAAIRENSFESVNIPGTQRFGFQLNATQLTDPIALTGADFKNVIPLTSTRVYSKKWGRINNALLSKRCFSSNILSRFQEYDWIDYKGMYLSIFQQIREIHFITFLKNIFKIFL